MPELAIFLGALVFVGLGIVLLLQANRADHVDDG